jgi:hypothetical protein
VARLADLAKVMVLRSLGPTLSLLRLLDLVEAILVNKLPSLTLEEIRANSDSERT